MMRLLATVLKAVLIVIISIAGSGAIVIINAEGHGVCALMSCDETKPCYPLTIIKECGIPEPRIGSFADALMYIITLPIVLLVAMFVFRKYYLQRKDFYIVHWRLF
jgi:hypothetical protein